MRNAQKLKASNDTRRVSILDLPDDLLHDFFRQHFVSSQLYELCLVNRRFLALGRGPLYSDVTNFHFREEKIIAFLISLCLYPHLAPLVRHLRFEMQFMFLDQKHSSLEIMRLARTVSVLRSISAVRILRGGYSSLLSHALRGAINLHSLALFVKEEDIALVTRSLDKCTFQLETLSAYADMIWTCSLLSRQSSLKSLTLCDRLTIVGVSLPSHPYPLPNLRMLGWSSLVSMTVVLSLLQSYPTVSRILVRTQVLDITGQLHTDFLKPGQALSSFLGIGIHSSRIETCHLEFGNAPCLEQLKEIPVLLPRLQNLKVSVYTHLLNETFVLDLLASLDGSQINHLMVTGYCKNKEVWQTQIQKITEIRGTMAKSIHMVLFSVYISSEIQWDRFELSRKSIQPCHLCSLFRGPDDWHVSFPS